MAYGSIFTLQWSCRILFHIQLIFQSIVFCEVDSCIYMQVLFLDILKTCQFIFYIVYVSKIGT